MIDNVHLVGCGNLGSKVAIKICKYDLAKKLYLYDPADSSKAITKESRYPFNLLSGNVSKSLFLKSFLENPTCFKGKIKIESHSLMVNTLKRINGNSNIIIDLRDSRKPSINPDISASVDGPILMLFFGGDEPEEFSFTEYIQGEDTVYSDIASGIITKYIQRFKKSFKGMYELNMEELLFGRNNPNLPFE